MSYAIWGEGIPTLLPRADVVHVVCGDPESDDSDSFAVPWDKVLALNVKGVFHLTRALVPPDPGPLPPGVRVTVVADIDAALRALRPGS